MCRPQGNTNQDYEISLQNIKKDIIYKNPEKPKNPEHKVLIKMWRNKKPMFLVGMRNPIAAVANSTTVYTKN